MTDIYNILLAIGTALAVALPASLSYAYYNYYTKVDPNKTFAGRRVLVTVLFGVAVALVLVATTGADVTKIQTTDYSALFTANFFLLFIVNKGADMLYASKYGAKIGVVLGEIQDVTDELQNQPK